MASVTDVIVRLPFSLRRTQIKAPARINQSCNEHLTLGCRGDSAAVETRLPWRLGFHSSPASNAAAGLESRPLPLHVHIHSCL